MENTKSFRAYHFAMKRLHRLSFNKHEYTSIYFFKFLFNKREMLSPIRSADAEFDAVAETQVCGISDLLAWHLKTLINF